MLVNKYLARLGSYNGSFCGKAVVRPEAIQRLRGFWASLLECLNTRGFSAFICLQVLMVVRLQPDGLTPPGSARLRAAGVMLHWASRITFLPGNSCRAPKSAGPCELMQATTSDAATS